MVRATDVQFLHFVLQGCAPQPQALCGSALTGDSS
jgi:hypothetical protein